MASLSRNNRKSRSTSREQPIQEPVGILSRTLHSSSSIRWILPARIRSPSKNDVVFVGQTFVQLREFQDSGQLVDTTAKLDFGTSITDAKVISAELKSVPIMDAILKQERDQEQFNIRGKPVGEGEPPQLVVLITRENDLIYLYARENSFGDVRLVFAKRPFLRGVDLPSSECRDITIDPQSRALAVASPSGYLGVFKLQGIDEIKSQIDSWDPLNHASFRPADEQRFIQVDGKILLMSFLPSPASDPDLVILLLLVYSLDGRKETCQYLYKWNSRRSLQTMKPMACSGRALREKEPPTMLIPSTRPYSCMVVMPTCISYYENVHSSEMKRVNCQFANDPQANLQWVQWSRPRRHTQYLRRRDDIVMLREDGLLKNFLIDKDSSTKFDTNNTIGHLGFSVDTAFCMLSGPPGKGGDIIIVGGSMTDGGVFHVAARGSPKCIQTIETLAPLNDIITGPPIAVDLDDVATQQGMPGRLYACSGPHDARAQISEIRYGLEAQIGWKMELPDAALVDKLFSMEIPSINGLFLLASHTTNSTMVAFELETQDISFTDHESHPGFDFDHPTLAATVVSDNTVVQVTTAGVNAIRVEAEDQVYEVAQLPSAIEHAAIFDDGQVIATTTRITTGSQVCLIGIAFSEGGGCCIGPRQSTRLTHIPQSICCVRTPQYRLVVIGTATGDLLGYNDSLDMVFEYRVQDVISAGNNAAISSLIALSQDPPGPTLLLCGLRSGCVVCLELKRNDSDSSGTDLKCTDVYRVGATAVQLVQEGGQSRGAMSTSALILCEYNTHRITLHPNTAVVDYTFSPLWVTDRTNPSAQLLINAIHRIPKLESNNEQPGGFLICATNAELLFCSLIAQEHGIAKHLDFDGIPKRLLFSKFLQKLVVVFSREEEPYEMPVDRLITRPLLPDEKDPNARPAKSVRRIGLQLITPHLRYPQSKTAESSTFSTTVTGDDSEVVHDFIDWAPTDGVNHYEWLVLALETSTGAPAGFRGHGRVVCVNAKTLGKGRPDSTPKVAYSNSFPVTAICAYKLSSLLIACGKEIILRHLDFKTRRWETLSRHALPSYANAISCQGSLICVATQGHSLLVLIERNHELRQHQCEGGMRYTKAIAVMDGSSAIFASADANGTDVIGLAGLNKDNSQAIPLFHAKIPGHIHRFRVDTSRGSQPGERTRFYGGTIDGTLFHFSLLEHTEWKLLHFVEEMSYLGRKAIKAVPMKKIDLEGKEYLWKPPDFKPKDMHVRGDRLLMMIEEGPYNLRHVLMGSHRLDAFKALVNEVVGDSEEPVEAAIAWMRRLLRYPPRS